MAIKINFNKLRLNDYAVAHDWEFVIPTGTLGALRQHPNWGKQFSTLPTTDDLNLRCKTMTLPKVTVKTERIKVYGLPVTVPIDAMSEGTISLVFLESDDFFLFKFFSAWRDLGASDRTYATAQRQDSVAGNVELRLAPDKDGKAAKLRFFLTGVYPVAVDLSQPAAVGDYVQLTVMLKFDNAGVA